MSAASAAFGTATRNRATKAPAMNDDCGLAQVAGREGPGKAARRLPEQTADLTFCNTRPVTGSPDLRAALREQLFQQRTMAAGLVLAVATDREIHRLRHRSE